MGMKPLRKSIHNTCLFRVQEEVPRIWGRGSHARGSKADAATLKTLLGIGAIHEFAGYNDWRCDTLG